MKNLILLLILVIALIFCRTPFLSCNHPINGKWYCISNNNGFIYDFRSDKHYSVYNKDTSLFFEGTYKINYETDTITFMEENGTMAALFQFYKERLIIIFLKPNNDQIDDYVILEKAGTLHGPNVTFKQKDNGQEIIIPPLYRGIVNVCYCQNKGQKENSVKKNNSLIYIPQNGLLHTQFEDDPFGYVKGNIRFYSTDTNGHRYEIPSFHFGKYTNKINELLKQGFVMDSVYVSLLGYNQEGRNIINKRFNKTLNGNVLYFKVDTLKNLLHNPYYNTYLDR